MLNKNKYVVMCVGFTHSGKTTFAKKLHKDIPNTVLIDNDEIAKFVNTRYKEIVFSDFNMKKETYSDPSIKFLLSKEIFKFSLKAGLNVIQSSGNLGKDARLFIQNNIKKYKYKLITVYFDLPEDTLLARIKNTKKDKKCFRLSMNWNDVLKRQKLYAELPPLKTNDLYFKIKNSKDKQMVLLKLKRILKNEKFTI